VRRDIQERDLGLQRIRHTTAVAVAFGVALAIGIADVAARSLPGRTVKRAVTIVTHRTTTTVERLTAPPLVPVASPAPAPQPSAPASPPSPTPAPPVVSSGGT
jgi:hypothetical protein